MIKLLPNTRRPAPKSLSTPQTPAPLKQADRRFDVGLLNNAALAAMAAERFLVSGSEPLLQTFGIASRPPLARDFTAPWLRYWARELGQEVQLHRKLWEYAVVAQAFYEAGVIHAGSRVVGFGVGAEPLPSYFASLQMQVLASDKRGVTSPADIFHERFLPAALFEERVEVSNIDLSQFNDPTLRGFDGCWSCSVLSAFSADHIAEEAVINVMDVLRPGGVAVHIMDVALTEVGTANEGAKWTRAFFEKLQSALAGRGHSVLPLDFTTHADPLDAYVDSPAPDDQEGLPDWEALWRFDPRPPHLKVLIEGQVYTSLPIIVRARR